MAVVGREVRLVARPHGLPGEDVFEVAEVTVPSPGEGEILIRNAFLSVDPYMRGRMNDRRSYVPPFALGEPMTGGAVGRVAESHDPRWPEGSWVLHQLGWREWALSDGRGLLPVDPSVAPVSTALGVLGMPGFTAWYGLTELGRPEEGETVFVSGAAGAVGSVAGQVARLLGCRVIGSAGSPDKVDWLRELGFDEAFSYRERPVHESLRELAPDGIDVYFDNVGGEILDAALARIRRGARIVLCGAISQYNNTTPVQGPKNYLSLLVNRARMEGMVVFDWADRFPEAIREIAGWMAAGKLRSREDVVEGGVLGFPEALNRLFSGGNFGKLVLRV